MPLVDGKVNATAEGMVTEYSMKFFSVLLYVNKTYPLLSRDRQSRELAVLCTFLKIVSPDSLRLSQFFVFISKSLVWFDGLN